MSSRTPSSSRRRAAGGVVWRAADSDVEVALVHRPRYDDWSLPKGKLEDGEHPLVAAMREVGEETGLSARAGRSLGRVSYSGKVVDYWSMALTGGDFVDNDEVDKLRWLPVRAARKKLSYGDDRTVLAAFTAQPAALTTVLLVRHGSAGQRSEWPGDDRERPLDAQGIEQALAIATVLPAYEPSQVIAAARTRCEQTVEPLAKTLGLQVQPDEAFTEEAHVLDTDRTGRLIRDAARAGQPLAICSQGGLIPDVVSHLAAREGISISKPRSRKGSIWALHFSKSHLVAADYFADLDPETGTEASSRSARKG